MSGSRTHVVLRVYTVPSGSTAVSRFLRAIQSVGKSTATRSSLQRRAVLRILATNRAAASSNMPLGAPSNATRVSPNHVVVCAAQSGGGRHCDFREKRHCRYSVLRCWLILRTCGDGLKTVLWVIPVQRPNLRDFNFGVDKGASGMGATPRPDNRVSR